MEENLESTTVNLVQESYNLEKSLRPFGDISSTMGQDPLWVVKPL